MPEATPRRILFSSINAIDIVHSVASACADQSLLQERASGDLWRQITQWANDHQETTRQEPLEFRRRYDDVVPRGGKEIWTPDFFAEHSGLYLDTLLPPRSWFSDRASEDKIRVVDSATRISREGVLTFRYDFEVRSGTPSDTAIRLLADIVKRAREVSAKCVMDNLSKIREILGREATDEITLPSVGVAQYALTAIEGFQKDGTSVEIEQILRSPELGGIINQSPWYRSYGSKHSALVVEREIGYREDEIYVVDRTSTVIVTDRFWRDEDTLRGYRYDLILLVEHYLSRLVCLRALGRELLQESIDGDRLQALQRVLNARRLIDNIDNSLSLGEIISQGFARRIGDALGNEIGLPVARQIAERRCNATLENISLRDAIESARTSASLATQSKDLASRNNWLQVSAITIAVLALVVSIVFGVLTAL